MCTKPQAKLQDLPVVMPEMFVAACKVQSRTAVLRERHALKCKHTNILTAHKRQELEQNVFILHLPSDLT